jgi:putative ABC transport system substrate-binding protein
MEHRWSVGEMVAMQRRTFVSGALAMVGIGSSAGVVTAQRSGVYRIGWLAPSLPPVWREMLQQGMREYGWVEARDFTIDVRTAETFDQAELAARALSTGGFDVLVASNTAYALALRRATHTVPIVMMGSGYPVEVGLAASLARPGGNVTGNAVYAGVEIFGKYIELLREVAPRAARLGVLWGYTAFPDSSVALRELQGTARTAGIVLQLHLLRGPDEVDGALVAIRSEKVDALFVTAAGPATWPHRSKIARFAIKQRLPSLTDVQWSDADPGILLTYSVTPEDLLRRAAHFVDRILRGARPGDLPIELPRKFELVTNMKTAEALNVTIPPSLLLRADQLIE